MHRPQTSQGSAQGWGLRGNAPPACQPLEFTRSVFSRPYSLGDEGKATAAIFYSRSWASNGSYRFRLPGASPKRRPQLGSIKHHPHAAQRGAGTVFRGLFPSLPSFFPTPPLPYFIF